MFSAVFMFWYFIINNFYIGMDLYRNSILFGISDIAVFLLLKVILK
jgi:hypothetical protein